VLAGCGDGLPELVRVQVGGETQYGPGESDDSDHPMRHEAAQRVFVGIEAHPLLP
jgi:hypothetical protein